MRTQQEQMGEWTLDAACRNTTVNFYPRSEQTNGPVTKAIETLCSTCPVQEECRDWGIRHEKYGWWGGLSQRALEAERGRRGIEVQQVGTL